MSTTYWVRVDEGEPGLFRTYEHRMPHGVLVLVHTLAEAGAMSMSFVPFPVVAVADDNPDPVLRVGRRTDSTSW